MVGSAEPEDWEDHGRRRRWRRIVPAVALLAVGAALVAQGLPGDDAENADGLVVDGAEDGAAAGEDAIEPEEPLEPEEHLEPDDLDPPEPHPAPGSGSDAEPEVETSDRLPDTEGALYALDDRKVVRLDLATGERIEQELPRTAQHGNLAGHLAVVGEHLVIAPLRQPTLVVPLDLSDEPVELGEPRVANGWVDVALAGPGGGAVTLLERWPGGARLKAVELESGTPFATRTLPENAHFVHVLGREAIVGISGEVFRYDLDTGEGEHVAFGTLLAANDDLLVYIRCEADLSCSLRRQGYDDDRGERIMGASSVYSTPWMQQLSPDGRWLNVVAPITNPDNPVLDSVAVDLTTGARHEPPHGPTGPPSVPPANTWTPDGAWLIEAAGSSLTAWQPDGEQETVHLDLEVGNVEAITTTP